MVDACLATGTHYLDITGEIDVFEAVLARQDEARDRGVVLLPGAGFDVVPSDCLAALLVRALPGAVRLELALPRFGGREPGHGQDGHGVTGHGGAGPGGRRDRSRSLRSPSAPGPVRRRARHRARHRAGGTSPPRTTPRASGDIVVYAALPPAMAPVMALAQVAGAATRSSLVQGLFKRVVGTAARAPRRRPGPRPRGSCGARSPTQPGSRSPGPSPPSTPTTSPPTRWCASPSGSPGTVAPGAYTPSQALGADFVRDLDGATVHAIG